MSNARNLANLLGTSSTLPASKAPDGTRILIHSYALGVDTSNVSFDNTHITDTYDDYILEAKHFTPTTDSDEMIVQCSSDNGSNYATSGHARSYLRLAANAASGNEVGTNTYIQLGTDMGNDANRGATFECRFMGLRNTSHYKYMYFESCGKHSSDEYQWRGGSSIAVTTAINNMRVGFVSGNIAAGAKVALYGIKGSNYS